MKASLNIQTKSFSNIEADYYQTANCDKNKCIIFVHGGPGFNRKYMDSFAQYFAIHSNIQCINASLPFHYAQGLNNPKKDDRLSVLKSLGEFVDSISKDADSTYLFLHSFAASLYLPELEEGYFRKLKKVFLSGFSSDRNYSSNKFSKSQDEIDCDPSSKDFVKELLRLYYYLPPKDDLLDFLADNYFPAPFEAWDELFSPQIKAIDPTIYYPETAIINGAQDPIVSPTTSDDFIKIFSDTTKSIMIDFCGHFPMHEKMPELTDILLNEIED